MSNFPQTAQVSGQPGSIRMPEAMPVPPVGGQNSDYGVSPGGFFVPELSARPHDGGSGFPQRKYKPLFDEGRPDLSNRCGVAGIGGFGGPAVQAANANALPPNPVIPPATASQKTSKPREYLVVSFRRSISLHFPRSPSKAQSYASLTNIQSASCAAIWTTT